MADFIIYHNPRCSKSRKTLELIKEEAIEPEILLYLDNPPSESELEETLKALDFEPREFSLALNDIIISGNNEEKNFK